MERTYKGWGWYKRLSGYYYISQLVGTLWLVNFAGRTLLYGPLTLKVSFPTCPINLKRYSATSIKQPPSIKWPLSKVPNYLSLKCCIWYLYSMATAIKRPLSKVPNYLSLKCCIWYLYSTATSTERPWPPFRCCKVIIYCFFTSIKRPANYLFKRNGDRKTAIRIGDNW